MERMERPNKRKTICFWFDYVRSAFNFNAIIQWVVRTYSVHTPRAHCTWCIVQHFCMHSTILRCSHISFHYIRFPFLLLCVFAFLCFLFSFHRFLLFHCIRSLGAIACRCTETHSHLSRIWKSPSRSYTINCVRGIGSYVTHSLYRTQQLSNITMHNINAWKWKCVWIVVHTLGCSSGPWWFELKFDEFFFFFQIRNKRFVVDAAIVSIV